MYRAVGWSLRPAGTLKELNYYTKAYYEVSDVYLWLLLITIYKNSPTVSGHLTNITLINKNSGSCDLQYLPAFY